MTIRLTWQRVMILALLASPAAHGLQDPTRPPGSVAQSVSAAPVRDLHIGSILLGSQRRVAVIGGVALQEGDSHDGVRVRRIYKDRVEVTDRGQPRVLYPEPLPQVRRTP
ncbi:hypothetical protein [Marinobacter halophilus]|uniref:MSHA biogenesis protein MshK n=1 Tax=Marinobacter halophilus TaxID=1323740 RepID=A0A2T1KG19_9GAMM|nr:hypothetical protein [Marinobacter halophilus]PSF09074.1 hypothetical protein C7H08_05615 [Marinobacter halophilus]